MTEMDELQADAAGVQALPPNARKLLRLVYIMGIVLVLLLIALVGGIIWKATNKVPSVAKGPAQFDLGLAPGEAITAVTMDGDRMAVTTTHGIVVVDLRKNVVLNRIAPRP